MSQPTQCISCNQPIPASATSCKCGHVNEAMRTIGGKRFSGYREELYTRLVIQESRDEYEREQRRTRQELNKRRTNTQETPGARKRRAVPQLQNETNEEIMTLSCIEHYGKSKGHNVYEDNSANLHDASHKGPKKNKLRKNTADSASNTIAGSDSKKYKLRENTAESATNIIAGSDLNKLRGNTADSAPNTIAGSDPKKYNFRENTAESTPNTIAGSDPKKYKLRENTAESAPNTIAGSDPKKYKLRVNTAESSQNTIAGSDPKKYKFRENAADRAPNTIAGSENTRAIRMSTRNRTHVMNLTDSDDDADENDDDNKTDDYEYHPWNSSVRKSRLKNINRHRNPRAFARNHRSMREISSAKHSLYRKAISSARGHRFNIKANGIANIGCLTKEGSTGIENSGENKGATGDDPFFIPKHIPISGPLAEINKRMLNQSVFWMCLTNGLACAKSEL